MFPVRVEAVEVTPGTEYQCNITGAVTDLGTVITGMCYQCVSVCIIIMHGTLC